MAFSSNGEVLATGERNMLEWCGLTTIDLWDPEQAEDYVEPPPPSQQLRTWTSADGRFTVEAEFVKAIAGVVTLRTQSGGEVDVPMEKLSEEDRQFLLGR